MPTAITNDIKITVEVFYKGTQSEVDWVNMYAYRISIENRGDFTAKLLRRHWYINDIGFDKKEVEGEGVVGEQPTLEPGQKHVYISGVAVHSTFAVMYGTYLMERQIDGKLYEVKIPRFHLIPGFILN